MQLLEPRHKRAQKERTVDCCGYFVRGQKASKPRFHAASVENEFSLAGLPFAGDSGFTDAFSGWPLHHPRRTLDGISPQLKEKGRPV